MRSRMSSNIVCSLRNWSSLKILLGIRVSKQNCSPVARLLQSILNSQKHSINSIKVTQLRRNARVWSVGRGTRQINQAICSGHREQFSQILLHSPHAVEVAWIVYCRKDKRVRRRLKNLPRSWGILLFPRLQGFREIFSSAPYRILDPLFSNFEYPIRKLLA